MSQRQLQPLFRWDLGWLYLLSGLTLIAAATILPARSDLAMLESQLEGLQAKELYCRDRLAAYDSFLGQWEHLPDELLVRLASAQLNQRPAGDRPVVLASSFSTAVTDWIDSGVQYDKPTANLAPQSMLSRLSTGRGQLWMLASGALAVFIGLVLGPSSVSPSICAEDDDAQLHQSTGAGPASRKRTRNVMTSLSLDSNSNRDNNPQSRVNQQSVQGMVESEMDFVCASKAVAAIPSRSQANTDLDAVDVGELDWQRANDELLLDAAAVELSDDDDDVVAVERESCCAVDVEEIVPCEGELDAEDDNAEMIAESDEDEEEEDDEEWEEDEDELEDDDEEWEDADEAEGDDDEVEVDDADEEDEEGEEDDEEYEDDEEELDEDEDDDDLFVDDDDENEDEDEDA